MDESPKFCLTDCVGLGCWVSIDWPTDIRTINRTEAVRIVFFNIASFLKSKGRENGLDGYWILDSGPDSYRDWLKFWNSLASRKNKNYRTLCLVCD